MVVAARVVVVVWSVSEGTVVGVVVRGFIISIFGVGNVVVVGGTGGFSGMETPVDRAGVECWVVMVVLVSTNGFAGSVRVSEGFTGIDSTFNGEEV